MQDQIQKLASAGKTNRITPSRLNPSCEWVWLTRDFALIAARARRSSRDEKSCEGRNLETLSDFVTCRFFDFIASTLSNGTRSRGFSQPEPVSYDCIYHCFFEFEIVACSACSSEVSDVHVYSWHNSHCVRRTICIQSRVNGEFIMPAARIPALILQ